MDYTALLSRFEVLFREICYDRLLSAAHENAPIVLEFAEIEKFDAELSDALIETPDECFRAAEEAIRNVNVGGEDAPRTILRVKSLPASDVVPIRDLRSKHIGRFVAVDGIIKQASEVRPEITAATFECKACGQRITLLQEDPHLQTPFACECGNRRGFDLVIRKLIDIQRVELEETPERLEGGAQPRKVGVFLRDDLVDPKFQKKVVPGAKVQVTGILNDAPLKIELGKETKRRDIYVDANYLEPIEIEFEDITITEEDEKKIKELASNKKIYDLLVQSIAPSIYGYEAVKLAVALQLFGGVRKVRPDKMVTRGDIHILLVGDPGSGKSQMLKYVSQLAPKARYVVGKSASGAGLCVAPDSLILNDNGFREISEFVEKNFDETRALEELPNAFSNRYDGKAIALSGNLKLSESEVNRIWRIKAPDRMIKTVVQSGKELCLTENTSLIRIKEGKTEWVRAKDLSEGDFVACARTLPGGNMNYFPAIKLLAQNKNIRIKNDVSDKFIEITDALVKKYGSIQNIAKHIGAPRDRLYLWRTKEYYHGIPLHIFLDLGQEAGKSPDELANEVKELFLRNGKNIRLPENIVDKDIAYLAGLMIGDGDTQLTKDRVSMRLCGADAELLNKAKEILSEKFGVTALEVNDGKRVPNIRFSFIPVYLILKAFGLSNNKEENTLSHLATEMPNEVLAALLSGLFDTDGFVSKSESPSIGISTISGNLAKNIQLSLLKFGIHSKLRERKVAGRVSMGKTAFNRPIISRHNQYYVEISGKENLELFREKVGFRLERKIKTLDGVIERIPKANTNVDVIPEINAELDRIMREEKGMARKMQYLARSNISRKKLKSILSDKRNEFLGTLADSDVFWERIVKKEEFRPEYKFVYDFSVRKHHNFIANGFFVHNTATVVKDEFMRGWALEAGALVLANNGMCAIDELDKMGKEDRSAMHEVMEQQTVTISKANVQATLHARTTILAAANPKFGRFDAYESIPKQIDIPETLMSRFDLIFPVRDIPNREKDKLLVRHILKLHEEPEIQTPPIDSDTLRKYVAYAKANMHPKLTKAAEKEIESFYVGLRGKYSGEGSEVSAVPIGARQLEALIRLSEASAKIALAEKISKEDAQRAIELVTKCLMEVGIDPETGKLDIDRLESGTTTTQRNKIKIIISLVGEMQEETPDKAVLISDVIAAAEDQGIERADEIIQKLKQSGELFEPKGGYIRKV